MEWYNAPIRLGSLTNPKYWLWVAASILAILFALTVWPTPYRYLYMHIGPITAPVRIDRLSGRSWELNYSPTGWEELRTYPLAQEAGGAPRSTPDSSSTSDQKTIDYSVGKGSPWIDYGRTTVLETMGIFLAGILGWLVGKRSKR